MQRLSINTDFGSPANTFPTVSRLNSSRADTPTPYAPFPTVTGPVSRVQLIPRSTWSRFPKQRGWRSFDHHPFRPCDFRRPQPSALPTPTFSGSLPPSADRQIRPRHLPSRRPGCRPRFLTGPEHPRRCLATTSGRGRQQAWRRPWRAPSLCRAQMPRVIFYTRLISAHRARQDLPAAFVSRGSRSTKHFLPHQPAFLYLIMSESYQREAIRPT